MGKKVKKKNKKQCAASEDPHTPPHSLSTLHPPPAKQISTENLSGASTEINQTSSPASLENSPLKVLVSSTKCNVDAQTKPKPERVPREEISPTSDKVVKQGVKIFNENVRKSSIASSAMNLNEFINAGLGLETCDGKSNSPVTLDGFNKSDGNPSLSEESEMCELNETAKIIPRQESESSGTDTAEPEFDDNVILREFDLSNDYGGSGVDRTDTQVEVHPKISEFVKPYMNMFPPPMQQISEDLQQLANSSSNTAMHEQLLFQPEDVRGYNPRKREKIDEEQSEATEKLDLPTSPQFDTAVPNATMPVFRAVDPQAFTINQMQAVQNMMEKSMNVKYCVFDNCKKKPAILCPTCEKPIYCTESHRKQAKKTHEKFCDAYRLIERKGIGKHTIAARNLNRAATIIVDKPIVVLPLNPSLNSRVFPSSYCVRCFLNKVPSSSVNRKEDDVDSCPSGCKLPICKKTCNLIFCFSDDRNEYDRVPAHTAAECKYLSSAFKRRVGKHNFLIPDQSVLGLLRCIRIYSTRKISDDNTSFLELLTTIKPEPYTKNFESKLRLFRSLLLVDASVVKDDELYRIDQALLRYGRNIGSDIISYVYQEKRDLGLLPSLFARCIFGKLAFILHSCVPNCMVALLKNLDIYMYPVKDVKKGEPLTYCYDERSLFMPTRDRRAFLLREFGYYCKCKRCLSASELDTHFSSYICSRCNSYIVPDNPLDDYSNWACNKCKKTSVFYLRVIDANFNFERKLEKQIKEENPLGLLTLMQELVDGKHLHWNHYLIFHASIQLFNLLWEGLNKNDLKVMDKFSKSKGLSFLKPAETVIALTQVFLPDGYAISHILPLRLACLIKLRQLTNQLERKETTLEKLDYAINEMYFRAFDISRTALYHRTVTQHTPMPDIGERNLQILEMKVIHVLLKAITSMHESAKVKVKALYKMYVDKTRDPHVVELIARKEQENVKGIFPWDLDV